MNPRSFVKPCRQDQLPAVLALLQATGLSLSCDSVSFFAAQLSHDPESILVYEMPDESIIGCVFGLYNPLITDVYHLAVRPGNRRIGVCRGLLDEMVDRCNRRGTACFAAYIRQDNRSSLEVARKLGLSIYEHPIVCVSTLT